MCGGGAIHTSCGFWCRHTCFPSEGRKGRLVLLAAPTMGATLRVAQTFGLTPSWGRRGDQTVRRVFLLGPTGPIGIQFLAAHCWPPGPTIPPPRTRRICGRTGRQCRLRRIAAQKRPKCGGLVVSPPVRGHCRHICGRFGAATNTAAGDTRWLALPPASMRPPGHFVATMPSALSAGGLRRRQVWAAVTYTLCV
jgi:hypothetical protein